MIYLQRAPELSLRPWIRSLWYCRAPQVAWSRERVLPNGCIQMVINLARDYLTDCGEDGQTTQRIASAVIVGARGRYEVLDTSDMAELAGVVLEPGGAAGVFRERADVFFEQSIAVDDVWSGMRISEYLRDAITPDAKLRTLEQALRERLRGEARRNALVDEGLWRFRHSAMSVAEVARRSGVSQRRFSQVFREEVGVGPKLWCRIQRYQAAVRALHTGADVRWIELALDCGYYDQSHFANDFKAFSGIDPTTYCALHGRWRNHVPLM